MSRRSSAETVCVVVGVDFSNPESANHNYAILVLFIALLGGGCYGAWSLLIWTTCKLKECCHEPSVHFNQHSLDTDIATFLYGQHLVKDVVVKAINAHWHNDNPTKPLVLSFHGSTGCGKNYVAEMIANNTYRHSFRSNFVQYIVATNDFPEKSKIEKYQLDLRDRIIKTVKKCQRSMFIFDETDKLPERLLGAIKPFLDYHSSISDVDFRKSIFIFLSNKGGDKIAETTRRHYEDGYPREKLRLEAFERDLMFSSYTEKGGLQTSELISNQLIDHFIPFLPLQREHVQKCVVAYLRKKGRSDLVSDYAFIEKVLNSLQYFPEESKAFSSAGCKRVNAKTDLELSNMRPRKFDDEF